MLTLAARVPDHGKLEPWRFIVMGRDTLGELAPILRDSMLHADYDQAATDKAVSALASPVIVAVVFSPADSPKVPEWEQFLSAGAVCMGLVNAALAAGWGAAWLTGFMATNTDFGRKNLGIQENERIVGLVHIGTRGALPPERTRPDLAAKTRWLP